MVAPPNRVYRAGVAVFGRRTPPFLQQIESCKRLGGAELFETPAANAHDLGFCKYGNFCGPSLPHRDAYNSRFAAETGRFADREFSQEARKRCGRSLRSPAKHGAVARFAALRSAMRWVSCRIRVSAGSFGGDLRCKRMGIVYNVLHKCRLWADRRARPSNDARKRDKRSSKTQQVWRTKCRTFQALNIWPSSRSSVSAAAARTP